MNALQLAEFTKKLIETGEEIKLLNLIYCRYYDLTKSGIALCNLRPAPSYKGISIEKAPVGVYITLLDNIENGNIDLTKLTHKP